MELHHLGIQSDEIPATVLLVTAALAARTTPELMPDSVVDRREFRSGRLATAPEVLVCSGARGAPSMVIALEELRRAGARTMVALTSCECTGCDHGLVVPRGAVRGEGTTSSYAPDGFPAVPDHWLSLRLTTGLGISDTRVVHTVDVPPRWLRHDTSPAGEPVDLESAAVLVAAAAGQVAAATVVVGRGADPAGLLEQATRAVLGQVPS